jgi:hypothetical protein
VSLLDIAVITKRSNLSNSTRDLNLPDTVKESTLHDKNWTTLPASVSISLVLNEYVHAID